MEVKKIIDFFKTDKAYFEAISSYNKIDGLFTIGVYAVMMLLFYFMGVIFAKTQVYLGIWGSIGLIFLCIAVVLIRKQKLSTVGITTVNIKKALLLGSILGIAFMIINLLANAAWGKMSLEIWRILYNIFYYFAIISFSEELIFRGFIQTRIYGLIHNRKIALIVVTVMFMLMHIPFQWAKTGMPFLEFFSGGNIIWLLSTAVYHLIFNFLYRKYNSLFTSTIVHGFLNFSGSLF